jgi:hypothetical protein
MISGGTPSGLPLLAGVLGASTPATAENDRILKKILGFEVCAVCYKFALVQ